MRGLCYKNLNIYSTEIQHRRRACIVDMPPRFTRISQRFGSKNRYINIYIHAYIYPFKIFFSNIETFRYKRDGFCILLLFILFAAPFGHVKQQKKRHTAEFSLFFIFCYLKKKNKSRPACLSLFHCLLVFSHSP